MIEDMVYATITRDAVMSERPGESGVTVEGAIVGGEATRPLAVGTALAALIAAQLGVQHETEVLLSIDGTGVAFALLEGCDESPADVLADGEGRYFDVDSLRPVDIHGRRITLAQAEHEARNHARATMARMRRAA